MAIHVALTHHTAYHFDRTVGLSPHVVRLRPAPHTRTPILSYSLRVEPAEHFINWQQDPFGNYLARLVFPSKATRLELVVDLVADMTPINPFDFFVADYAAHHGFAYEPSLKKDLLPYLDADEPGPLLREWMATRLPDGAGHLMHGYDSGETIRTIDYLMQLNMHLQQDIAYSVRMEPGVQEPETTLARGIGSCRDSGWLLVQILRRLGYAARFVSGYLVQLAADVKSLDGPSGPDADFTDLHAWCEVYVPGAGWVGLDPTSGLAAGEGHIPLAATPDPRSAAPVEGAVDECEVTFEHANTVQRIHEDPRVTKPYTPEQWRAIDALGHAVDAHLRAGDVRLTQGGEPTFVSIDDMDSAQWNTAADGRHKRERAWDLAQRLFRRFAAGGLIHHGQGKWYPGEPLPRWQTGLYWRADGHALWRDPALLQDPSVASDADIATARHIAHALAAHFGVPGDNVHPAYEDALHRLWQEATLPIGPSPDVDVDPTDEGLLDTDERRRLVARLQDLTLDPVGFAVPLHHDGTSWATAPWRFRRGSLQLLPGDSPMGLRLPLQGLSWSDARPQPERSAFDQLSLLRPSGPRDLMAQRAAAARQIAIQDGPFSAVCVELRDGRIHIFLPPLTHLEHSLDLLGALQDIAADADRPIVLEGYPPPHDPRLRSMSIAPDPGVIEVNVPPAADWEELKTIVEGVYDDAHHTRLGTEKFDLDGTHTGSGGGNHITIGGPTPSESPLLRRPDLLRSLITYWQHHPSLSYLFSGTFVGPTSQAPRVDEGRVEALHELETALAELDRQVGRYGQAPAWIVDRLLRHLLTDLTGNTHRAEFCIDKLHSPDSERGRLGLLEMRGFEMPPHPQMAMVQSLLVRALVARFWDRPYRGPMVRWGGVLHDRFLLPWFCRTDIDEVTTDLREHGYPFDDAWIDPFVEFRFPRLGTAVVDDVEIELRQAIEPWMVLGEETTAQGTARFVDSAVERVQVTVSGLTPGRHIVTVNGVPVPMTPTSRTGTSVGAVRYKAWQPPSGLHPTIEIHSPLRFDLIDRWNRRSLGGATYHVVHPGGRGYDTFPVNALEADARRHSRFEARGHTPGRVDVEALDRWNVDGDHPRTLDLRRVGGS